MKLFFILSAAILLLLSTCAGYDGKGHKGHKGCWSRDDWWEWHTIDGWYYKDTDSCSMTEREGGIKLKAPVCTDDGFWFNCTSLAWYQNKHEVNCSRGVNGCHCTKRGWDDDGWCHPLPEDRPHKNCWKSTLAWYTIDGWYYRDTDSCSMTEREGGIRMHSPVCTDDGFWYNCTNEAWWGLLHEVKCNRGVNGCHCTKTDGAVFDEPCG